MKRAILIAAAAALAGCGKGPEAPAPKPAPAAPAAVTPAAAPAEEDFVRFDSAEPEIPAAPDHTQAHPGPDDALKADRAGLTVGTTDKSIKLFWLSEKLPGGNLKVWAGSATVKYKMAIAISVSSNLKEGTCPYAVTWDHELSHARAYVSIFNATRVHLTADLDRALDQAPPIPTKDKPLITGPEGVEGLQKEAGERLRRVLDEQEATMRTLMDDHKRDRDSPAAYKADFEKCPAHDWDALQRGT
jgi:hypothetical protein